MTLQRAKHPRRGREGSAAKTPIVMPGDITAERTVRWDRATAERRSQVQSRGLQSERDLRLQFRTVSRGWRAKKEPKTLIVRKSHGKKLSEVENSQPASLGSEPTKVAARRCRA